MLGKAFQQTHVWPTSYSCLEFPRTARTGNWFPRMENAGNPASENLQWRKLVSENPVCRKLACRELLLAEARLVYVLCSIMRIVWGYLHRTNFCRPPARDVKTACTIR